MIGRIIIDDVRPSTPGGQFPAKAVAGVPFTVRADVFTDGHDRLAARSVFVASSPTRTGSSPPRGTSFEFDLADGGNDSWGAEATLGVAGLYRFWVEAWRDRFSTWKRRAEILAEAGADMGVELEEGARLLDARAAVSGSEILVDCAVRMRDQDAGVLERMSAAFSDEVAAEMKGPLFAADLVCSQHQEIWVDRIRAGFGAWYELFPRSHGGFRGVTERLGTLAEMGFDVLYLPPIHPIGHTARKGRNNSLLAAPDDPGSPWAIGSEDGGHEDIHPELGTVEDFEKMIAEADASGVEIALDYALQCSPDHPWVKQHPEWFVHRADGSIAYAENPPKKYQDIVPFNFWPEREEDRVALWEACLGILETWIGRGVKIFRVDNPHTKPVAFWEWCLGRVRRSHPEVIFLAEAFTRPKMMAKLAEVGFSQSYTYFTWRRTKEELAQYGSEVHHGPSSDYMRPNFWPNTPDILSHPLRGGPRSAFAARLVLAALMVPNYGVYSGYELCENEPASEENEEYLYSEKYEVKERDYSQASSLSSLMATLNGIRRNHQSLQRLGNFYPVASSNPSIFAFARVGAPSDTMVIVVNLDPYHPQEDTLTLDLAMVGMPQDREYVAHDELSGERYSWIGPNPYVRLDPSVTVAHVLSLSRPE